MLLSFLDCCWFCRFLSMLSMLLVLVDFDDFVDFDDSCESCWFCRFRLISSIFTDYHSLTLICADFVVLLILVILLIFNENISVPLLWFLWNRTLRRTVENFVRRYFSRFLQHVPTRFRDCMDFGRDFTFVEFNWVLVIFVDLCWYVMIGIGGYWFFCWYVGFCWCLLVVAGFCWF